jgi:acyl-CoA thioesterase FadM
VSVEAGLVETYRGGVAAWECDVFGHLNIAFYVDRFADAALDLLERHAPGRRWRTLALDTRYDRELRAGAGLAIRSALLEAHPDRVRIAHELVESATGTRASVAEHVLAPVPGPVAAAPSAADFAWQPLPPFAWPPGGGRIPAGRDRAAPAETAEGGLSLLGCLHRFSNACLHVIDSIGMMQSYRELERRGFATFETRLAIGDSSAIAGEGLVTTSDVVMVGRSSLAMVHRLHATRDGRPIARFYQAGVHFDLAARRSAPWPAELRMKAEALRVA